MVVRLGSASPSSCLTRDWMASRRSGGTSVPFLEPESFRILWKVSRVELVKALTWGERKEGAWEVDGIVEAFESGGWSCS